MTHYEQPNHHTNRYDVIGCQITRADMPAAIERTLERIRNKEGGYVCFTNVHASVMGHQNPAFRAVLDDSYMTLPDGKPLFWVARLRGLSDVGHVPGPDFLPRFLETTQSMGLRHYFFGSTPQVLAALTSNLRARFPGIDIVGSYSPPFRDATPEETSAMILDINRSRPDIVWMGLGAPKQEMWMAEHWRDLQPAILMGVGAAFDFHAGIVKRAPQWFTMLGIEWLHRLIQEPKRLWRRYLVTNSLFVYFLITSALRSRKCNS